MFIQIAINENRISMFIRVIKRRKKSSVGWIRENFMKEMTFELGFDGQI